MWLWLLLAKHVHSVQNPRYILRLASTLNGMGIEEVQVRLTPLARGCLSGLAPLFPFFGI